MKDHRLQEQTEKPLQDYNPDQPSRLKRRIEAARDKPEVFPVVKPKLECRSCKWKHECINYRKIRDCLQFERK